MNKVISTIKWFMYTVAKSILLVVSIVLMYAPHNKNLNFHITAYGERSDIITTMLGVLIFLYLITTIYSKK